MNNVRLFFPAFIMLLGYGFVVNSRSQDSIPLTKPLTGILPTVEGFRTRDDTMPDAERLVAGMDTYVLRTYFHDSIPGARDTIPAFSTFVSYYERQSKGRTIHSPKNCLPGAGWEVRDSDTIAVNVDGVPQVLNHYVLKAESGWQSLVVIYWYQGRGRIVANEYRVKWNLLRDAAILGHTEEALVRVVVPLVRARNPSDTTEARRLMADADALAKDIAARLARDVSLTLPPG